MIRRSHRKYIAAFSAMLFLLVSILSLGMCMTLASDTTMIDCMFAGDGTMMMCPMTIAEHIGQWRGLLSVLLVVMIVITFVAYRHSVSRYNEKIPIPSYYKNRNTIVAIYQHLVSVFSDGILNSKRYELSVV